MKMKRFLNHFLSMSIMASVLVLTSCGEDTEDPVIGAPSFEVTNVDEGEEGATTVNVGEEVSFTLNVVAPGGFNRLLVEKTVGEDGTTETYEDIPRSGGVVNDYTYEFSYTPTAEEAGETIYFDFLAVDDANVDNTYQYVINVNNQEVVSWDAVLLSAPTNDDPVSRSETFFSTRDGEVYSVEEVNQSEEAISETIDFGYFYGSGDNQTMATLASPAAYPFQELSGFNAWEEQNETMIKPTALTQSEFIEQGENADFIISTYEAAEFSTDDFANEGRVNRLSEGDVLAFMTDPGEDGVSKYGLIYVNEITGTDTSTSSISISVKVIE